MRKKKNVFEHIGSLINDPLGLKAEAERKKRIAERRKHQFGRLKKDEKKKMEGK